MIALASGLRVYLACGVTDMRKGMTGLAMLVQQTLAEDPFGGAVFAFRGRRAGLIKLIWHDGVGLCMLTKRLEQGQFAWPSASTAGRISRDKFRGLTPQTLAPTRRHRSSPRGADSARNPAGRPRLAAADAARSA